MQTVPQEMKQTEPPGQDTKRSRQLRNRILIISGAGILLFAIVIGAFVYGIIAWTTSFTSPVNAAADQYYAAIAHQQYATAYSHLAYNEVLMSEEGYTQAAMSRDASAGKVTAYSISNVTASWNFGQNIASTTVHVTRAHQSYDVHLALKLEGNTYKITKFDGI